MGIFSSFAVAAVLTLQSGAPGAGAATPFDDLMKLRQECRSLDSEMCQGLAARVTKACDGGDLDVCVFLARMVGTGEIVEKNVPRAIAMHERACEGGKPVSCTDLGVLYAAGHDVKQDFAKATKLFNQACEAGDAEACGLLASFYEEGRGVEKDMKRAMALHKRACDAGEAPACVNLGVLYADGREAPGDLEQARGLFTQACEVKYAEGCFNLGIMADSDGAVADAGKFFGKACDLGMKDACEILKQGPAPRGREPGPGGPRERRR